MNKRLLAFPLVLVLALSVGVTSAFADVPKAGELGTAPEVKVTSEKAAAQPRAKLKKDMDKLVNDARAGKIAPRPQQFPQTSRNNLSKTTKIAILAAAVGSAITLIVIFHELSKD